MGWMVTAVRLNLTKSLESCSRHIGILKIDVCLHEWIVTLQRAAGIQCISIMRQSIYGTVSGVLHFCLKII